MRTQLLLATLLACASAATSADAAILRPFTRITAGTVRLGDLFDELGATPDRVLGTAPAPGARIVVGSPQLAAIARDFDVDWRPQTGGEHAVVERRADVLPQARVSGAIRTALIAAGAAGDFDVTSPDIQPVLVPVGSNPEPAISQLSTQPDGHFSALVSIDIPDSDAVQIRVSGQVIQMTSASVATRRLSPGTVLENGDVRPARVRAAMLHSAHSVDADAATGMSMRHDVQPGQVLTLLDLSRPTLVQRGAVVRMSLSSDGLSLTAQGVAAESGGRGDRIRVENPLSHLMVVGEVTGQGEVRVAPRGAVVALASVP